MTATDEYIFNSQCYTRDKSYVDTSDGRTLPGEGNLYVTSLQEKAAVSAKIDAYLSSGLPVPRDYGCSFFVDGDFVALRYKGALVQQLTEVGNITDQLEFSVYPSEHGEYGVGEKILVEEQGNKYTAKFLSDHPDIANQPLHCMVRQDNEPSIFGAKGSILPALHYDATESVPLDEVLVLIEPYTTDKDSIESGGSGSNKVDNDAWVYVGMAPSSNVDAIQVLRADSEYGQYNAIATITGEQDMFIDRDVASMNYYYHECVLRPHHGR